VDIYVHVLYHGDGLAMLYVNNSEFTISEEIEFKLDNCHIDGCYGSYKEVVVKPGRELLLKVVRNDGNDFKVGFKKLFYKVF